MKYTLVIPILLYQAFFPKKWRGKCLYRESCSNHVKRVLKEDGLTAGWQALRKRIKNCKPGYILVKESNHILLITVQNHVIPEMEIDQRIIDQFTNKSTL